MDGLVLLEVIRDLSVILFMTIGIFVMILFTVFGVIIYRKFSESVDSVRSTLKSTEETAKVVTNSFLKPVVGGSMISFVASKIFKNFSNRAQDKKE